MLGGETAEGASGANDASIRAVARVSNADSHCLQPSSLGPWRSWDTVPPEPPSRGVNFYLEIFAGQTQVSRELMKRGVACLPPIDVVAHAGQVPCDITDVKAWIKCAAGVL